MDDSVGQTIFANEQESGIKEEDEKDCEDANIVTLSLTFNSNWRRYLYSLAKVHLVFGILIKHVIFDHLTLNLFWVFS